MLGVRLANARSASVGRCLILLLVCVGCVAGYGGGYDQVPRPQCQSSRDRFHPALTPPPRVPLLSRAGKRLADGWASLHRLTGIKRASPHSPGHAL